jgi:hypothetical protein
MLFDNWSPFDNRPPKTTISEFIIGSLFFIFIGFIIVTVLSSCSNNRRQEQMEACTHYYSYDTCLQIVK